MNGTNGWKLVYNATTGRWCWRLRQSNGTVLEGAAYRTKADALQVLTPKRQRCDGIMRRSAVR